MGFNANSNTAPTQQHKFKRKKRTKEASSQIYKSAVQWNVIIKGLSAARTSRNSSAFHLKHFVCVHVNYGLNIVLLAVARCQGVTCFFSWLFSSSSHTHRCVSPLPLLFRKHASAQFICTHPKTSPKPPKQFELQQGPTTTLAVLATSKKGHTPVRTGPGRNTKKRVYGPAYFCLGLYASSPPPPPAAPLYVVKFHVSESNYDCDES